MKLFDLNIETKEIKVSIEALKTLLNTIGDGVAKVIFNTFFNEIVISFTPVNNTIYLY